MAAGDVDSCDLAVVQGGFWLRGGFRSLADPVLVCMLRVAAEAEVRV
jgi:hypothetical protein